MHDGLFSSAFSTINKSFTLVAYTSFLRHFRKKMKPEKLLFGKDITNNARESNKYAGRPRQNDGVFGLAGVDVDAEGEDEYSEDGEEKKGVHCNGLAVGFLRGKFHQS